MIVLPLDWELESTQIYLVEDEPLTLIDTGVKSQASLAALESALEELGYGIGDLERVVLDPWPPRPFRPRRDLAGAGSKLECWVHEADAPMVEDFESVVRTRIGDALELFRETGATRGGARAHRG